MRLIHTARSPAARAPSTSRSRLSPTITAASARAPSSESACRNTEASGLPTPRSPETTTASNRSARPEPASFSRCRHEAPLVTSASGTPAAASAAGTSANTSCRPGARSRTARRAPRRARRRRRPDRPARAATTRAGTRAPSDAARRARALEAAPQPLPRADPDPAAVRVGRRRPPQLAGAGAGVHGQPRGVDLVPVSRRPRGRLERRHGGGLLDHQRVVEVEEQGCGHAPTIGSRARCWPS